MTQRKGATRERWAEDVWMAPYRVSFPKLTYSFFSLLQSQEILNSGGREGKRAVLFGGYENGRPPFTCELWNEIYLAGKSFIRWNTSHCAR